MNVMRKSRREVNDRIAKNVCTCPVPCNTLYSITDRRFHMVLLCETTAREIAKDILGLNVVVGGTTWTTKQEAELIEYIKLNGIQYGTYPQLAKFYGKTASAIKAKVERLRKAGRL